MKTRRLVFATIRLVVSLAVFSNAVIGQEDEKPDVEGSCGGKFSGSSGTIASPGFPDVSTVNTNCTYEIEVDPGLVVAYRSTYMNLEKDCYDYLLIFPTKDASPETGIQFCDRDPVPLEATEGNKLTVFYHSDAFTPSEGFVITWYALDVTGEAPSFNCSFDGPLPLCAGWTQSEFDQADFDFRRDKTPSKETGPDEDSSGEGRYAYLEASNRDSGDNAILISPEVNLNEHDYYCFSMMYHNYGSAKGIVRVTSVASNGSESIIFSSYEETNKEWVNVNKTLLRTEEPLTVFIEATRGKGWKSDVAVDDVKLLPYPCLEEDVFLFLGESNFTDFEEDLNFTSTDYQPDYGCLSSDFLCSDQLGDCIPDFMVCDGHEQCANGLDEDPATCADIATSAAQAPSSSIPPPTTCQSNMQYHSCVPNCNRVCSDGDLFPLCDSQCVARCACPPDLPVLHEGRCIAYVDCPAPPLEAVTALTIAEVTTDSVLISFSGNPEAELFQVFVYPSGSPRQRSVFDAPNTNKSASISQKVTSLQPGSSYSVSVDAVRREERVSSGVVDFTTRRIATTNLPGTTPTQSEPPQTEPPTPSATTETDDFFTTTETDDAFLATKTNGYFTTTETDKYLARTETDDYIATTAINNFFTTAKTDESSSTTEADDYSATTEADDYFATTEADDYFATTETDDYFATTEEEFAWETTNGATTKTANIFTTTKTDDNFATTEADDAFLATKTNGYFTTTETDEYLARTETDGYIVTTAINNVFTTAKTDDSISTTETDDYFATTETDDYFATTEADDYFATTEADDYLATTEEEFAWETTNEDTIEILTTPTEAREETTRAATEIDGYLSTTEGINEGATSEALSACWQQRDRFTEMTSQGISPPIGAYLPDCTEDGSFMTTQCDGSPDGYCFCVDGTSGEVFYGTQQPRINFDINCLALTPCQLQYHNATLTRLRNPSLRDGPIPPSCTREGLFTPRQCNLFTLVCWCADPATGVPMPGTETDQFEGLSLKCGETESTPAPQTTEDPTTPPSPAGPTCKMIYGSVITYMAFYPDDTTVVPPDCLEDGSFRPLQCNKTSEVCWCVDRRSGVLIPGTATSPGKGGLLNCSDPKPQVCGGSFGDIAGEILSPGYPGPYAVLRSCVYTLKRPDATYYVEMMVEKLNLAPPTIDGDCISDRLDFGDADRLQFNLCGNQSITGPIYFDSDVIIQFVPEGYEDEDKGFRLTYEMKRCELEGQLFSKRASSCDKTCSVRIPLCSRNVVERCVCPPDRPFLFNGTCITADECPASEEAAEMETFSSLPEVAVTSPVIYDLEVTSFVVLNSSSDSVCVSLAGGLHADTLHVLVRQLHGGGESVTTREIPKTGEQATYTSCIGSLDSGFPYSAVAWSSREGARGAEVARPFVTTTLDVASASTSASPSVPTATVTSSKPVDVTTASPLLGDVTTPFLATSANAITDGASSMATSLTIAGEGGSTPAGRERSTDAEPRTETTRPGLDESVSLLEVDAQTVCVKILHSTRTSDVYLVSLDDARVSSAEGASDRFEEVAATSPSTYACFYDLEPARDYAVSVMRKEGGSIVEERASRSFTSKSRGMETTPQPVVFEQTEQSRAWQKSYSDWRTNSLNTWYTTMSGYLRAVAADLPSLSPDSSKCPEVFKPRCASPLEAFADFNGCLFFICRSPSTGDDLTEEDLASWEKEHSVFKDYLMPQWQELFAAYAETQKQS